MPPCYYWNYHLGPLSFNKITAYDLKIGYPYIAATGARTSNGSRWLNFKVSTVPVFKWVAVAWFNSLWCNDATWRHNTDLGQHWLRWWLTWTIVAFSLARFCGIYFGAMSLQMSKVFCIMSFKVIFSKLLPHVQGASELNIGHQHTSSSPGNDYQPTCHISQYTSTWKILMTKEYLTYRIFIVFHCTDFK